MSLENLFNTRPNMVTQIVEILTFSYMYTYVYTISSKILLNWISAAYKQLPVENGKILMNCLKFAIVNIFPYQCMVYIYVAKSYS